MEKYTKIYLFGEEAIKIFQASNKHPRTIDGVEKILKDCNSEYTITAKTFTPEGHKAYVEGVVDGLTNTKALLVY